MTHPSDSSDSAPQTSRPAGGITHLCVYCGAASGGRPSYARAARELGLEMARRGIVLVYGGGRAGMMGHVADAVLDAGGVVTGIITRQLMDRELGHTGIQELKIVDSMHERKKAMADIVRASGGFIALPGGVGTMDELFEILAWKQLGLHECPVGVLNVEGFYDPLLTLMEHMEAERFLRISPRDALIVRENGLDLLDAMGR